MDEKRLYDILGQNVEVPDMVNKKLEQTYGLITQKKRPMKRRGFRPVRTVLVAAVLIAALCVTATAVYQLFRQDVAVEKPTLVQGILGGGGVAWEEKKDYDQMGRLSYWPRRELTPVDEEQAMKLLGDYLPESGYQWQIEDFTFTVDPYFPSGTHKRVIRTGVYPCGLAALLGRPGPSAAARAGGDLVSAEAAGKTALLHNGVCRVAGFYLPVYGEVPPSDGAVPDIMVSFAMADEGTAVQGQLIPDNLLVLRHYMASLSHRSDTMRSWIGAGAAPFSSSSSGTMTRTRSTSASKEPDSNTRPGTSSLSAIQTRASASHVSLTNNSILLPPCWPPQFRRGGSFLPKSQAHGNLACW